MKKAVLQSLAVLLAFALLTGSVVSAWQGQVAVPKGDEDALKATDEILQVVSKIRQLEIKQPIKRGAKTRDEIKTSIIQDLDDSNTPAQFEATAKTLKKLGMLPSDFHLRDYMISLLTEQ